MARATALSPECIRRRIGELGEWFQNLDLMGIPTAPAHFLGNYPAAKWQPIAAALPASFEGMSVLDIGCNAGFHALACKRRGAGRVVGIDIDPRYLNQARFAAEVLELDVEWRQMSAYAVDRLLAEQDGHGFDFVFFMGVFYHLRYPLYALDLAVQATTHRLVFQTMLRGDDRVEPAAADYSFWDHSPFNKSALPRMHFIEHRYAGDPTNWWIPNRAAAEAILRSAGLELLDHPEPETWICSRQQPAGTGSLAQRELAGRL